MAIKTQNTSLSYHVVLIVLGNNRWGGRNSRNRIKAICMIKELARGKGGGRLLMVFIMCNAAESFVFTLTLPGKIGLFLAALAPFTAEPGY